MSDHLAGEHDPVVAAVQIRVRGVVGPVVAAALSAQKPFDRHTETVLVTDVADEAELHGILVGVRDLGLELMGVHVDTRLSGEV
jgi:hypothetical protein